jgi:transposase
VRGPDKRRAIRQERSRPLFAELEPWLREKLALVSRKSKLAQAIRYALSHWDRGGENWAVIASLIETCKLSGVDPTPISPTRS